MLHHPGYPAKFADNLKRGSEQVEPIANSVARWLRSWLEAAGGSASRLADAYRM